MLTRPNGTTVLEEILDRNEIVKIKDSTANGGFGQSISGGDASFR